MASKGFVGLVGLLAAWALLLCVEAPGASILIADDVSRPSLQVDSRGNAEVDWTQGGVRHSQFVPPSGKVLPGGHAGADVSRPASAPGVPLTVVVRKTADGTLWALQAWRPLPGGPVELHLASWQGEPTKLELSVAGSHLTGRATFHGKPVTGFSSTPAGQRPRIYVLLDCFGCPAGGSGWGRMLGVAPHADGSFRVLLRPDWQGRRYRATVAGPNLGTTRAPDAQVVVAG